MGFFSNYGQIVERELLDGQINPGDIIVDVDGLLTPKEESTRPTNPTSAVSEQCEPTPESFTHRPQKDGSMPRNATGFERQVRHAMPPQPTEPEQEAPAQEKQDGRSSRGRTERAAREWEDRRESRGDQKKAKTQRKAERRVKRGQGRRVDMRLDKVVFHGELESVEC